jgi:hypothetical protein
MRALFIVVGMKALKFTRLSSLERLIIIFNLVTTCQLFFHVKSWTLQSTYPYKALYSPSVARYTFAAIQGGLRVFHIEDGGDKFFRNIGSYKKL